MSVSIRAEYEFGERKNCVPFQLALSCTISISARQFNVTKKRKKRKKKSKHMFSAGQFSKENPVNDFSEKIIISFILFRGCCCMRLIFVVNLDSRPGLIANLKWSIQVSTKLEKNDLGDATRITKVLTVVRVEPRYNDVPRDPQQI